ncbi:MAG: hypothetical protein HUJ42_03550 [Malacoplasma sp.]|nr:hypothetical protein [Malacoplasma sp.]
MKKYSWYSEYLKKNNLNESEIKSSNVFEFLNKNFWYSLKLKESLFISKIQSMSLETNPSQLRIRNDNFLNLAKNKIFGILISGIKIENKTIILVFCTKSFYEYDHSVSSSNSTINFSWDELKNFCFSGDDTIQIKTIKRHNNIKGKYIFYSSNDLNFNKEEMNKFFYLLDCNFLNLNDFLNRTYSSIISPKIPDITRSLIKNRFNDFCSLSDSICPCGKNINTDYLRENKITYVDIHHFAPKELLIRTLGEKEGFLDWEKIHNEINLIPLCSACHQGIHKGRSNLTLVCNIFDQIKKVYEKQNKLDFFKEFLYANANMELDNLLEFYKRC